METTQPGPRREPEILQLQLHPREVEDDTRSEDICSQLTDENWRFGDHSNGDWGHSHPSVCHPLDDFQYREDRFPTVVHWDPPGKPREAHTRFHLEFRWAEFATGLLWENAMNTQTIWGRCIFRWGGILGMEFYRRESSVLPLILLADSVMVGQLYLLLTTHLRLKQAELSLRELHSDPILSSRRVSLRLRVRLLKDSLEHMIINTHRLSKVYICWLATRGEGTYGLT